MPRLAEGYGTCRIRSSLVAAAPERSAAFGPAWLATAGMMAAGCGFTIPRLYGVETEHQAWQGEQAAARLAIAFIQADVADPTEWADAENPGEFLKRALERWVVEHGGPAIRESFFLDLTLSTGLDRYSGTDGGSDNISRVFLTLEPESAGYIVLGPTLRLLESVHPRLPATFANLFLGALNRWVRVYDYRDAIDRVERLREWYEADPDGENIELPDIGRCVPAALRRRPLGRRTKAAVLASIKDGKVRALIQAAIELDRLSRQSVRPEISEGARELLADSGEPVPALLAVFERSDPVEGSFNEESQGMLELVPEPNLIIEFNGEAPDGIAGAFAVLSTVCETLACASRLMALMPGNQS